MDAAKVLAFQLGVHRLRNRTGVLLVPPEWFGREQEIAARLTIGVLDLRTQILNRLAPGQRRLGLDWESLINREIEASLREAQPDGGCILVANLDLLLCGLRMEERSQFWQFMRDGCRPRWGVLLVVPKQGQRVMLPSEREEWENRQRLASWQ